jgi:predicted nucleic acid-binding protein
MKFILDASVIAKLFLQEKYSLEALDMMTLGYSKNVTFISSELALYEVGNVFWKHLRKKDNDGSELINQLLLLDIEYISLGSDLAPEVLKFAHNNDISYYDAVYIVLSNKYQLNLVTEDKKLLKMFDKTINIIDGLEKIKEEEEMMGNDFY